MEKSENIKNIAAAIGKFTFLQSKIGKDGQNPFFKSKYATLSKILDSIEANLREAGLVFTQFPDGNSLTTILIHADSGEYFQASYDIHAAKNEPQAYGSAISYARRYAITSILGLNVDDDDGEAAQKAYRKTQEAKKPKLSDDARLWNRACVAFAKGETTIEGIRAHRTLSEKDALLIKKNLQLEVA